MSSEYPKVHLVIATSLDGKVAGKFLFSPENSKPVGEYFKIYKEINPDAFSIGKTSLELYHSKGFKPDLTPFKDTKVDYTDNIATKPEYKLFSVVLDRKGVIGWKKPVTFESMEGFNGAHVIEVLTEKAPKPFIAYCKSIGISYIFAGKEEIDLKVALKKLKKHFGIKTLAVCGGSGINGSFYNENLYDQLDIIMSPIVGENEGLTLFGGAKDYRLYKFEEARPLDHGVVYLKYSKI